MNKALKTNPGQTKEDREYFAKYGILPFSHVQSDQYKTNKYKFLFSASLDTKKIKKDRKFNYFAR